MTLQELLDDFASPALDALVTDAHFPQGPLSDAMTTPSRKLQHFLALLAYRTQQAVRDAPASFGGFDVGSNTRSPHEPAPDPGVKFTRPPSDGRP